MQTATKTLIREHVPDALWDTARSGSGFLRGRIRRARLVKQPLAFFFADLIRAPGTRSYTLVDGWERVRIRHRNGEDSFVLSEIFDGHGGGTYAQPPVVARALRGRVGSAVDLGGNIGLASIWIARDFPRARIVIVEADPTNASVLEQVVSDNIAHRASVIRAAAGIAEGTVTFVGGLAGRSHAATGEQPGDGARDRMHVPMIDALPLLADAHLLKMDIEGGEWPILADPRLADTALRGICLEYHGWGCPEADAAACAHRLLGDAGFEVVSSQRGEDPAEDTGVLWALRAA